MNARRTIATLAAVCVIPGPAWAHATIPGIGGAYVAFAHATTEPAAALALLGLGLLLGLHGAEALQWTWPAFFTMMVAGIASTLLFRVFIDPELPLVLIALVTGALAAGGAPLPRAVALGLGLVTGYFFGVLSAPSPASFVTQAYWIGGSLLGANLALVFIVAAADTLREHRHKALIVIGLRVIASWVAAIAVLVTALSIR